MSSSTERGTMSFRSTLPDPENHPFFTEVEVEEVPEHWLVRLFERNVSRWLRKRSD